MEDRIISELESYMRSGGFPEIVLGEGDERLLGEYFKAIIYRDIVTRYRVRDPQALELLSVYVLRNYSNLMSFRSISQSSGLSTDTAGEYLSYLEKAFMICMNRNFTRSTRGQLRRHSPVKVYATDLGMANGLMLERMVTRGRWAENLVVNEMGRYASPLYYWRNGHEVDILSPKTKEAVQVCYGPERDNEIRAFEELPFKEYKRTLITRDEFDQRGNVKKVPLWTFLLSER
jgi:hypothetical protein